MTHSSGSFLLLVLSILLQYWGFAAIPWGEHGTIIGGELVLLCEALDDVDRDGEEEVVEVEHGGLIGESGAPY